MGNSEKQSAVSLFAWIFDEVTVQFATPGWYAGSLRGREYRREFWTDWLPTETLFLPHTVEPSWNEYRREGVKE